ncbi:hypothetical protein [Streptomyces morookaense]|uniref:Secreted protein n=1 Tax=Streptomyces morookaense TaxID=1970 RepID=A0A7Y7BBS2_STRMO|nr:hypothetical protein [Streptomyces morookaense]NVK82211.1 hypothetical protein [Streptomyces morookaense]GHF16830.1 hypothetical protein GCM10010359_17950 [Streptomyces morookaense]
MKWLRTVASAAALGVVSVGPAAGPAVAKGGIDFKVVAHRTVRAGHAVAIHARGDDDAVTYTKVCIQERTGRHGPWHMLKCGRMGVLTKADVKVTPRHRGVVLAFRAVLLGSDDPHDRHPAELRSSAVRTVRVR